MKATDAYRKINNSPIKGIILYYTEQLLKGNKVDLGSVISQIQTGKTPPKADLKYYESSDVNWFKPSDIGYSKFLIDAKEKFSKIAVIEKKATIYPQNTLLMIGIGGGVGRVSVLKEEGSSNQQITGISFNADVSSEYAYYYYLAREDYIKSKAKSMSFPILNQARIKELDFRYPLINEQNEFVKFIDYCWDSFLSSTIPDFSKFKLSSELKKYALKQFKAIKLDDEIQGNIKKELKLLSQLKQSILQEAIQGELTTDWRASHPELVSGSHAASELLKRIKAEKAQLIKAEKIKKEKALPAITKEEIPFELPDGWVWTRLGDICSKTGSGSTPRGGKSAYPESGISFLRSQNVYDDGLRLNGVVFISDTTHEKMKGTKVQSEDLLLNITGGSIGRCCIVPKDFETGNINQHVAIIRTVNVFNGYFIHKVICSPYFQNMIFEVQTGAGREGLPKNKMDNILIAFPSLEEQKEIVKKVELLMAQCQQLEQEITKSEDNAQMLMQAVLKEAFSEKEKQ